jgi:hypothetical protein
MSRSVIQGGEGGPKDPLSGSILHIYERFGSYSNHQRRRGAKGELADLPANQADGDFGARGGIELQCHFSTLP